MATLTKTLKTQGVNLFGPSPSEKWLQFNWGQTWGMKSAGVGSSPNMIFQFNRTWSKVNTVSIIGNASSLGVGISKRWSKPQLIVPTYSNSKKIESSGNGYFYTFIDRVINAESMASASIYTTQAANAVIYTSGTAQSATWS